MNRPNIIIDARMVGPKGHGIAMYVEDLARGLFSLQKNTPLPYQVIFLTHGELSQHSPLRNLQCQQSAIPFLHPKEIFLLPNELKKLQATLYHSPSFSSLLCYPCPHLITVHDLNHLQFGSMAQKFYYNTLVKRAIRSAKKVFTVSEFSRQEIRAWCPGKEIFLAKNAIHPLAVNTAAQDSAILKRYALTSEEYFFTLSNNKKHKNLDFLKHAYGKYREQTRAKQTNALPLVLAVEGVNANGIMHINTIDHAEVSCLLRHAKAFFFPSLYEGFGRPPLEAALAGTPVIASSISAHEEALSILPPQETLLLDPRDESAWVQAFFSAIDGKLLPISAQGRARILSTYSVENLAGIMDKTYRELIGSDAAIPLPEPTLPKA